MALRISTGFENVITNNSDHNNTNDGSNYVDGVTTVKRVLNDLYFENSIINVGYRVSSSTYSMTGSGTNVDKIGVGQWTPGTIAPLITTTNNRGGGITSEATGVTPVLVLSSQSFTDGFFVSYKVGREAGAGVNTGGRTLHGLICHDNKFYTVQSVGDSDTVYTLKIVDSSASNFTVSGDNTYSLNSQTTDALNTPVGTDRRDVDEIKFGITSSGVIKYRVNDVETQYNTGVSYSPVASSFIYICGSEGNQSDVIGSVVGVIQLSNVIDDMTINDGTGVVDNDLPPIREGYSLTRPQDHGNFLTENDITLNGQWYSISAQSTVDFTTIGAPDNSVGTIFQTTSAAILQSGDILQERFAAINIPGQNDPVPIGASTNEATLLDFDTSTYSKFFRLNKFGVKVPPLSSVVETPSAYEDSIIFNVGARNLGINTSAEMGVSITSDTSTVSADIVVDTVEKYAGSLFVNKTGITKYSRSDFDTLCATIFREDV